MRPIDGDELLEHVWRDKLDSRELIDGMIRNAPTLTTKDVVTQNTSVVFKFPSGSTPMTVADAVIRECADKEWLEDVVYFLNAYLLRTYKELNKED